MHHGGRIPNGGGQIVICNDAQFPSTATVTFVNPNDVPCTITMCTLPGWNPPTYPPNLTVPPEQNGQPGTLTVQFAANIPAKTYYYNSDCCGQTRTNPRIVVT